MSDEYEFCIGIVGLSKDEYFRLTPAETYTKVQAYLFNRDSMSANFRALFHLQYSQWAKHPKSAESLWPLSIDQQIEQLSEEELYARNKAIIEQYSKN